jgi:hypothetical protein
MNIAYVLPRNDFFTCGYSGRTSHANGFIDGLLKNNCKVSVFSGGGMKELYPAIVNPNVTEHSIAGNSQFIFLIRLFFKILSKKGSFDYLVIRYSVLGSWLSFLFRLAGIRFIYEVNSTGFLQNKGTKLAQVLRLYELIPLRLSTFNICVSSEIVKQLKLNNCYLMPNAGGDSHYFKNIKFKSSKKIDFMFFGKIHEYYDLAPFIQLTVDLCNVHLHVYGDNGVNSPNITYHGQYQPDVLFRNLECSEHSFLILPYKKNTIADIGSPTKLFDYFALGLPILSTSVGQLKDYELMRGIYFYNNYNSLKAVVERIGLKLPLEQPYCEASYLNEHTWKFRVRHFLLHLMN